MTSGKIANTPARKQVAIRRKGSISSFDISSFLSSKSDRDSREPASNGARRFATPPPFEYNIARNVTPRNASVNVNEAMRTLKAMGTAQNVKVYKRHGAGDNLFGVSFANLKKLKQQIKVDHDLATELWKTGNTDAMSLATMIADPTKITAKSADDWLKSVSYGLVADLLSGLVAKSKHGMSKFKKWSKSKKETTRQCGYGVLASMLRDDAAQVSDELCLETLTRIEAEIHSSPNRARQVMNTTVMAIGIYKPKLQTKAIATARKIGKVDVDHGETGCKTPDAEAYIKKAAARKEMS
jgi:3-methyladenine DNA glycosylase AlkD